MNVIQLYLYQVLSGLISENQVKDIYFFTPHNVSFPYLFIDDLKVKHIQLLEAKLKTIFFKIKIFTKEKNIKQIALIIELIKQKLSQNTQNVFYLLKENFYGHSTNFTEHELIFRLNILDGDNDDKNFPR